MAGGVSGWHKRMEDSCVHESFFRVHCGAYLLNLVNGRGMVAMDATGSVKQHELHDVIKWLRKESNLVEEMGIQSPYHNQVRWSSLENDVAWYQRCRDRVSDHCVQQENDLSENLVWWMTLVIIHEHFKVMGKAMKALQGEGYLLEQQTQRLQDSRDEIADFHGVTRIPAQVLAAPGDSLSALDEGCKTLEYGMHLAGTGTMTTASRRWGVGELSTVIFLKAVRGTTTTRGCCTRLLWMKTIRKREKRALPQSPPVATRKSPRE
jgi:hypothetical protein